MYKNLCLSVAVSAILISCGGTSSSGDSSASGGGNSNSGGNSSSGSSNTLTTANKVPVIAPVSPNKNWGHNDKYIVNAENIPTPPASLGIPEEEKFVVYQSIDFPDGRKLESWGGETKSYSFVDGKPFKGDEFDNLLISPVGSEKYLLFLTSFSYLDPNGTPNSFYLLLDEQLKGVTLTANDNSAWTWDNVPYAYSAIKKPDSADAQLDSYRYVGGGKDGKIDVENGKWQARLGDVTLDGKIEGYNVRGTATGDFFDQKLQGEFAGLDGNASSEGQSIQGSFGGFAGGDDNAAFSGGWVITGN